MLPAALLPVTLKPLQFMVTFCAATVKQVPADDWSLTSVQTVWGVASVPQPHLG